MLAKFEWIEDLSPEFWTLKEPISEFILKL